MLVSRILTAALLEKFFVQATVLVAGQGKQSKKRIFKKKEINSVLLAESKRSTHILIIRQLTLNFIESQFII